MQINPIDAALLDEVLSFETWLRPVAGKRHIPR